MSSKLITAPSVAQISFFGTKRVEPGLNVRFLEAEMAADLEPRRALVEIPPLIDRRHRDLQLSCELLNGQQIKRR